MDPERWRQVKDVLQHVSELAPQERPAYLERSCDGDAALRAEVEELLKASGDAGEFLETPALARTAVAGEFMTALEGSLAGSVVGHYRVLDEVGRGGMAVVYKALREDDFRQEVALKVMKRGMDTDELLERFRHERQILAELNHNNIARLLDGGTTADARPYFVMEFVEGIPVTEYCEKNNLSLEQRLRLFLKICSAVAYAHQNLVIHRDLKPANILVTSQGEPKLLDFGIAKVFSPDSTGQTAALTAEQVRLLTPEYAAPEQVRGERITMATDIYALGAVLYELLTGAKAHKITNTGALELERAICLTEPAKPSESGLFGKALRGDLDNIVLKALEKQPERRYSHADQLAGDIERHLDGRPVLARPDTIRYRTGKFCRRHRAFTAGAAAVLLTLIAGIVTTSWQARVARRERAVAQRRFDEVRKLGYTLLFEIDPEIASLAGATKAREKLLSRSIDYLDALARDANGDPGLLRELAQAYEQVAQVRGVSGMANLGQADLAEKNMRKALTLREELLAVDPASSTYLIDLSRTTRFLASMTRDAAERKTLTLRALSIAQTAAKKNPNDNAARLALAGSYYQLGEQTRVTNAEEGIDNYRKALALYRDPSDQSLVHKKIGAVSLVAGKSAQALEEYNAAIVLGESVVRKNPGNARAKLDLSYGYSDLGFVLSSLKRYDEALRSYAKAEAIRVAQADADPGDLRARSAVVSVTWRMGDVLAKAGKRPEALARLNHAVTLGEALVHDFPDSAGGAANDAQVVYAIFSNTYEMWGDCANASHMRDLWKAKVTQWKLPVDERDLERRGGVCK